MRRPALSIAAIALLLTVALPAALAANPHFIGTPTFTDQGTTLNVTGKIAGLGNEDITVTVTAQGVGSTVCTNKGGNQAPGINKKLTTVGSVTILRSAFDKNGNVVFNVTTAQPGPVTAKEAGCPNNNWTATVTDVDFTEATITVVQGGQVVISETFTGL